MIISNSLKIAFITLPIPFLVDNYLFSIRIKEKDENNDRSELLLINKFRKRYKRGDIVTMIDPKKPDHTILSKITATDSEIYYDPYISAIPNGYFLYRRLNTNDRPKPRNKSQPRVVSGPLPVGFVTGIVLSKIPLW
ncbi:hypothetical protein CYY_007259 [Polysphondylium violaceum]|uniref:Uncharacterized protein n=1 Tax=Polysphondylium violaceum TaxID=133409 RepID=A0A8J4UXT0_9MYCE|nr:hypothetical protein CYY_007259 [Polysphondylium violaceum]